MMVEPPIGDLVEKAGTRFGLVVLSARRARQINAYVRGKEETVERRWWSKAYRARTKHQLRTGQWEDILPPCKTSGWLSW